jgi:streptogramin lyase
MNKDSVARITTAGAITTHFLKAGDDPSAITAGPDGALWFTGQRPTDVSYDDVYLGVPLPRS